MRAALFILSLSGCGTATLLQPSSLQVAAPGMSSAVESSRLPVIVVPGLQGSTLLDPQTDKRIWGDFEGDYADPGDPQDIRQFALPMRMGVPLDSLRDEIVADGLMSRFSFRFLRLLPLYADGYNFLIREIETAGYTFEPAADSMRQQPCYTAFVFTYDWRRDNAENAQRLSRFVDAKRTFLEQHGCFTSDDHRFDIVAHSMGALVARYYLRYGEADLGTDGPLPPLNWSGGVAIRNAVFAAPPNSGSLKAFRVLMEGRKYLDLARYEPAILGTMPALYQLLPREGGGSIVFGDDTTQTEADLFDVETWKRNKWGLADPNQLGVLRTLLPDVSSDSVREVIAIDHLAKILTRARRFSDALDSQSSNRCPVAIHILAGDTKPTEAILSWQATDRTLQVLQKDIGDATVLVSSTRISGLSGTSPALSTTYVKGKHLSMTRGRQFGRLLQVSLRGVPGHQANPRGIRKLARYLSRLSRFILPYAAQPNYLRPRFQTADDDQD